MKAPKSPTPPATQVEGGGLDPRIGGSISPNFEKSPETDIGQAGLTASNAQAGIANNRNRTPESAVSTDQAANYITRRADKAK